MRYVVEMADGTTIEVEADSAVQVNDQGKEVVLDAPSYDAVDLEAAGLILEETL
jgi:hypothetical protein